MYARQSKHSPAPASDALLSEICKGATTVAHILFIHEYSIRTLNLESIKSTLDSNLA